MEQVVYADIYFLINFSMDFLCLFLCARLLSIPFPFGRTLLGAAVGGVYAVLSLFLVLPALPALLLDMAVCALLCLLVFHRRRAWRQTAICIPVFLATSMLLGGIMTALFHLLNRLPLPPEMSEADAPSTWGFALLAGVSAAIAYISEKFFRRRTATARATLHVVLFGRRLTLTALCDSGNLLHDPISGKPCIVVDAEAVSALLPPTLRKAVLSGTLPKEIPDALCGKLRFVPTQTATGGALLATLRPDALRLQTEKGIREIDALLTLSPHFALSRGTSGASALLPTELLL